VSIWAAPHETSPTPMWLQAVGRASATATCPDGYTGSWATWPHEGKGCATHGIPGAAHPRRV